MSITNPSEALDAANEKVTEVYNELRAYADESFGLAVDAVNALANNQPLDDTVRQPAAPNINIAPVNVPALTAPTPPTQANIEAPSLLDLPTLPAIVVEDIAIPDFNPAIADIQFPAAPGQIDVGTAPDAPQVEDISVPDAPTLPQFSLPDLVPIDVPTYQAQQMPEFNGTAPTFNVAAPNGVLEWNEPQYQSDTLNLAKTRLSELANGFFQLPGNVQDAIFAKGRDREASTALAATQGAFDTFAGRGFDMPPGVLVEQVRRAQIANQQADNALSRDIVIKSAEWANDNMKFALQQIVSMETVLIGQFNNMAQRGFETARIQFEGSIQLYNALVAAYNVQQQGYKIEADVYGVRVQAWAQHIEVFKAQLEAERVKGTINEQRVNVYRAQIDSLNSYVNIYKSQVDAAQARADLQRAKIEGYRSSVEAYGKRIDAQKSLYDAYETQVKAEAAKIGVVEAQSRVFAETVRAIEAKANIQVKKIEAQISGYNAQVTGFKADAEAKTTLTRALTEIYQGSVSAYTAQVGAFTAQNNANTSRADLDIRRIEAINRNSVALYEVSVKEYDAAQARLIEQAKINIEALKAVADTTSQLAAGSMSALHVGAQIQGSGTFNGNNSTSFQVSHQKEYQAADGENPPIIT